MTDLPTLIVPVPPADFLNSPYPKARGDQSPNEYGVRIDGRGGRHASAQHH